MAFSTSYVLNSVKENLGVLQMSNSVKAIPASQSVIVFETDKPFVLDALDWYPRNETTAGIKIMPNGYTGAVPTHTGQDLTNTITPADIIKGVAPSMFNVVNYDTSITTPLICFTLKQPMYFPQGVKIELTNTGDAQVRNGAHVRGREL